MANASKTVPIQMISHRSTLGIIREDIIVRLVRNPQVAGRRVIEHQPKAWYNRCDLKDEGHSWMTEHNHQLSQPADETAEETEAPQRRRLSLARVLLNLILIFIAAGVIFACVATVGVARQGQRFFDNVANLFAVPTPGPTATPRVDLGPVVLHRVQGLSELTTTQFGMQTVVTASKGRALGPFEFNTRLLYVAYGEVRAGIDLRLLGPADVVIQNDQTVTITLPPPRILDSKIDVERSYVYDFQQGVLSPEAPELQTEAERQALQQIVAGACQSDILQQANDRAELAISKLLETLNFEDVVVNTRMPEPAVNPCSGMSEDAPPGVPTPATAEPSR